MTGDVLGGGVVVVLAAALWLIYLVPTWLRRREYLATERNAVRLQQTLRILAETAEVPQQVRVEATAREVAAQQRILRKEEERAVAEAVARTQAIVAEQRAEAEAEKRAARAAARDEAAAQAARGEVARNTAARARARSTRRARAATSLLLLCALVITGFGIADAAVEGTWFVLAGGLALATCAVVVLARLARTARAMMAVSAEHERTRVPVELFDQAVHDKPVKSRQTATWTPKPLPKPLYLSQGTAAASAMASVDAAQSLRRAAAKADLELRAAQMAPEVATLKPRTNGTGVAVSASAPQQRLSDDQGVTDGAAPSRFARMGIVDDVDDESLNVDDVLRRRRAVG